jgi:hypothetical protein
MTPTAKLVHITPTMARKYLDKNTMNRPLNQQNLEALAKEMSHNNFHVTGESIKVAKDGTLLDGQHRLQAIVFSGKAVKMFLIEGLEKDAFKYMDTGRTRQASDVLAIEGVTNATKIAGMVKFIINFNKGYYSDAAQSKAKYRTTNAQVSEFVEKHAKQLADSYDFGFGKGKRLISGSLIAALHFIFKKNDERTADIFIEKLVTGAELTSGNPIHQLRERFVHDQRSTRKMPSRERIALICKAWNLVRTKKTVVKLHWDIKRDPFPKPM